MRRCRYCGKRLTSTKGTFTVITHNRNEAIRWFCSAKHLRAYFDLSQGEMIKRGKKLAKKEAIEVEP